MTVTGAPKRRAMQFIEDHERSPRGWYGGAIGMVHFNGDLNTGLTLRTIRIKEGIAEVRAGATLLAEFHPGRGGARDAAQGFGHARRDPPGGRLPAIGAPRRLGRPGASRSISCSSTMTTASSTCSPVISANAGRR